MGHHTKEKGDFGALKAHVSMASLGFKILVPLSEHLPFDFVAYKDGRLIRVQVKYSTAKNGAFEVKGYTCWNDKTGSHHAAISKSEIDVVCVYCPDTDKCYFLDPSIIGSSIKLRILPSKNKQQRNVRDASSFEVLNMRP